MDEEIEDFELPADWRPDDFDEDEDPEAAYNTGRDSDPSDPCPYFDSEAIAEWYRGRESADRSDLYSMSRGSPPDRYRDPD